MPYTASQGLIDFLEGRREQQQGLGLRKCVMSTFGFLNPDPAVNLPAINDFAANSLRLSYDLIRLRDTIVCIIM